MLAQVGEGFCSHPGDVSISGICPSLPQVAAFYFASSIWNLNRRETVNVHIVDKNNP
jgi:hypothetical protein